MAHRAHNGPNRSGCLDWGVGGQPNLGNAWILGTIGLVTHPLGEKIRFPKIARSIKTCLPPPFTLPVLCIQSQY